MSSSLNGVIADLRAGRPLRVEQIDEIERTFDVLKKAGWSGYIPADEAVEALVEEADGGAPS